MWADDLPGLRGAWKFELFDDTGHVVLEVDGDTGDRVISKEEVNALPYMKDVTPGDIYNE